MPSLGPEELGAIATSLVGAGMALMKIIDKVLDNNASNDNSKNKQQETVIKEFQAMLNAIREECKDERDRFDRILESAMEINKRNQELTAIIEEQQAVHSKMGEELRQAQERIPYNIPFTRGGN